MEKEGDKSGLPTSSLSLKERTKDIFLRKNLKPSTRQMLEEVCRDFENLESYALSNTASTQIRSTDTFTEHKNDSDIGNENKSLPIPTVGDLVAQHEIVAEQDSHQGPCTDDALQIKSHEDSTTTTSVLHQVLPESLDTSKRNRSLQEFSESQEKTVSENFITDKQLSPSLAELADAEIVQTSDNSVSIIITNPRLIKVLTSMKNAGGTSQSPCCTAPNPNTNLLDPPENIVSLGSTPKTSQNSYQTAMVKSSPSKSSSSSSLKFIESGSCDNVATDDSLRRSETATSFTKSPAYKGRIKEQSKPSIDANATTKARRITAKMKAEWAKELEKSGHLECPMIGCFQTYVTVANFQTHYKWCTGKKDLKLCLYCDSLIFSSQTSVLHHMEVEHPEKVEEYKAKFPEIEKLEIQDSSTFILPENEVEVYVEEISQRPIKFQKRRSISSKENRLLPKKAVLKHKMKSINDAAIENIREFKKCVRFDNIVHKLNSVGEVARTAEVLHTATDVKEPKIRKKRIFLTDSVAEEKCFEDSDDFSDNQVKSETPRIDTKARLVLNAERYSRYNESLKLTRDWSSERKTYSRSRNSDSFVDSSNIMDLQNDSIQDTHQLNESTECTNLSLQSENELLSKTLIEFPNVDNLETNLEFTSKFICEETQQKRISKVKNTESTSQMSAIKPVSKSQIARVPCYNQSNISDTFTKLESVRRTPPKMSPIIIYGKSVPGEQDAKIQDISCDFDTLIKNSTPIKVSNKKSYSEKLHSRNASESIENCPLLTNYLVKNMAKKEKKHDNNLHGCHIKQKNNCKEIRKTNAYSSSGQGVKKLKMNKGSKMKYVQYVKNNKSSLKINVRGITNRNMKKRIKGRQQIFHHKLSFPKGLLRGCYRNRNMKIPINISNKTKKQAKNRTEVKNVHYKNIQKQNRKTSVLKNEIAKNSYSYSPSDLKKENITDENIKQSKQFNVSLDAITTNSTEMIPDVTLTPQSLSAKDISTSNFETLEILRKSEGMSKHDGISASNLGDVITHTDCGECSKNKSSHDSFYTTDVECKTDTQNSTLSVSEENFNEQNRVSDYFNADLNSSLISGHKTNDQNEVSKSLNTELNCSSVLPEGKNTPEVVVKRGRGRPRKVIKTGIKNGCNQETLNSSIGMNSISGTCISQPKLLGKNISESKKNITANTEEMKSIEGSIATKEQVPVRKSERVRKRKLEKDFSMTLEPDMKKSKLNSSLVSEKTGSKKKQGTHVLKDSVLNEVKLKSNKSEVNFKLGGKSLTSRKGSRKGRPKKCVRYADINCGMASPESQDDVISDLLEDDPSKNGDIERNAIGVNVTESLSDKCIKVPDSSLTSANDSFSIQSENLVFLPKRKLFGKTKAIRKKNMYSLSKDVNVSKCDEISKDNPLKDGDNECVMEVMSSSGIAEKRHRPLRASASKAQRTMLKALRKSLPVYDSSSDKSWKSDCEDGTSEESGDQWCGKQRSLKGIHTINIIQSKHSRKRGSRNRQIFPVVDFECLTAKHLLQRKSEVLFASFKPKKRFWQYLPEMEYTEYFPPWKSSIPFKIEKNGSQTQLDWVKLNTFESESMNDGINSALCFTGGPISSSAWCPMPFKENSIQYLALSTNCSTERISYACTKPRKGLIQLWNFGCLTESGVEHKPVMEFAISHNHGVVLEMAWCPFGCWEDPSEVYSEDDMPRLGLLAVACSDSYIRIYSIPHPNFLPLESKVNILCSWPSIILQPLSGEPGCVTKRSVCCSLSWQTTDKCQKIAGGYGNGMICIWQVNSSFTLHTSNLEQKIITPYLIFQAHGTPVLSLAYVPLCNGYCIASSSFDRTLKFWNLRETSIPIVTLKKGYARDAHWAIHCCDILGSLYDGLSSKPMSFFKECGTEAYPIQSAYDPMPSLTKTSCSELLNALAMVDLTGSLYVSFLHNSLSDSENKPLFQAYHIFKTDVVLKDATSNSDISFANDISEADVPANDKNIVDLMNELLLETSKVDAKDGSSFNESCENSSLFSTMPLSQDTSPKNHLCTIAAQNQEDVKDLINDLLQSIDCNNSSCTSIKDIQIPDTQRPEEENLEIPNECHSEIQPDLFNSQAVVPAVTGGEGKKTGTELHHIKQNMSFDNVLNVDTPSPKISSYVLKKGEFFNDETLKNVDCAKDGNVAVEVYGTIGDDKKSNINKLSSKSDISDYDASEFVPECKNNSNDSMLSDSCSKMSADSVFESVECVNLSSPTECADPVFKFCPSSNLTKSLDRDMGTNCKSSCVAKDSNCSKLDIQQHETVPSNLELSAQANTSCEIFVESEQNDLMGDVQCTSSLLKISEMSDNSKEVITALNESSEHSISQPNNIENIPKHCESGTSSEQDEADSSFRHQLQLLELLDQITERMMGISVDNSACKLSCECDIILNVPGEKNSSSKCPFQEGDFTKYGLVFRDADLRHLEDAVLNLPKEEFSLTDHTFCAMNTVAWNPNYGYHFWLFSAGQAGLGRLSFLSKSNSRETVSHTKKT